MVSRLNSPGRSSTAPRRRRNPAAPAADSLTAFLIENREKIHRRWVDRLNRHPLPDAVSLLSGQMEILDRIYDQLQALLAADTDGRVESILAGEDALAFQLSRRGGHLLPEYFNLFIHLSDSIRELLREKRAFRSASAGARKRLLQRLETAFSILIHREIHAFAEGFHPLLRQEEFRDILLYPRATGDRSSHEHSA